MWLLAFAAAIEIVTCFLRFGGGMESTKDTTWFGAFTGGVRIHHGYVGLLVMGLAWVLPGRLKPWAFRVGGALFLSDVVHHFVVLWAFTGSPQFDLTYPPA